MSTKVRTMIVNATELPLTMKVGNRNCFFRVASVKNGGGEYVLENKSDAGPILFVNSDECCDYERIPMRVGREGLDVTRVARKQFQSCGQAPVAKRSKLMSRF